MTMKCAICVMDRHHLPYNEDFTHGIYEDALTIKWGWAVCEVHFCEMEGMSNRLLDYAMASTANSAKKRRNQKQVK